MSTKQSSSSWAIVTGASYGLGYEFALQLAQRGFHLILVARTESKLQELAQLISERFLGKIQTIVLSANLLDQQQIQGLLPRIQEMHPQEKVEISVLVNNAGLGYFKPFIKTRPEQIAEMIQLNILSLTLLTSEIIPHMQAHGKKSYIANISSIAGEIPVANYAVYAATKSFVNTFTDILRFELSESNISITTIAPGPTISEFAERSGQKPQKNKNWVVMDAGPVISEGLDALFAEKKVSVSGPINKILVTVNKFLPRELVMGLSAKAMKFKSEKKKSLK